MTTTALNRCTGQRPGDPVAYGSLNWHGKYGHFNVVTLDHDSIVTDYGKHDRTLVTFPDHEGVYIRVDHLWELGMPTEKQLLKLARKEVNLRGKWKLDPARTVTWNDGKCTDCYLIPADRPYTVPVPIEDKTLQTASL